LTFTGDAAVTLNASFAGGVSSLVDSANTMTGLTIGGTNVFQVDNVSSTSLATVTITDTGPVLLFDKAAMGNVLTISDTGATGGGGAVTIGSGFTAGLGDTTFGLTANGDTVTIGSVGANNNSVNDIFMSGSKETVTIDGTGANLINVTNSNDTVTVGDLVNGIGSDVIHATGASATVTLIGTNLVGGGAGPIVTVGNSAVVNLSSSAAHFVPETVVVTGDTTGGTSAAFLFTTLNKAADASGQAIVFGNSAANGAALTEQLAGASVANSMVNVASVSTLPAALDLAASLAATANNPNPNFTTFNQINAQTGVIDWFQFQGNTYIVEAVNGANAAAPHPALAASDTVVELTGLVNIAAGGFAAHTLTL
jgi:hypothetical protein